MKFAILLLVCCCAVVLAKPDGSKEVTKPPKHSSKEINHSGSNESKESSEESGSKSSNESGKKDGGGAVIPGLPQPNIQQVELLLDRVVEIVANIFGLSSIHGYVDLIHLIESNPLGNLVWTIVVQPFLKNITNFQQAIISYLAYLQSTALQFFPILHLFMPLELPQAIIRFVFWILHCVAQIFSRPI